MNALIGVSKWNPLITKPRQFRRWGGWKKRMVNLKINPLAIVVLDHHRSTPKYLKPLISKVLSLLHSVKLGEVYEVSANN